MPTAKTATEKNTSRALVGKVAVVTGSTSGIGLGIARHLAQAGADVVINGLGTPDVIEKDRAAIAADYNVKAFYHDANMMRPKEIAELIKDTQARLGSVDILVNNAGIQHTAPIEDFPDDNWDSILSINLSSAFHTIKAALPGMKKKGWGRIINIASVHGLVASVNKAAYVAAKHGLVGLTKVVALETAQSKITCNAICPGWVLTPLVERQIEAIATDKKMSRHEAEIALLEEKQPSKRFVEIDQLGALAVFLCSDAASGMTGISLPVDGGWISR